MTLAVENIGELVTLAGHSHARIGAQMRELQILRHAAVVIDGDRIAAAGLQRDLRDQIAAADEVIDARGRCVTPGFVDAHTHLVFAGDRANEFEQRIAGTTYQEIAAAGGGILRTVRLTREASEDTLLHQARQHRDWMLRGGTTTIEAKSGYGLDGETELKMMRVLAQLNNDRPGSIVPTLLAAHTVPPEFANHREQYVQWLTQDLLPQVAQQELARYCDVFCDEHAFTVEEARSVLTAAKYHGLGLRIHAEQFAAGSGAALAAELGAATADHLEMATEDVLEQLRRASVQPVLLPGSVFALGRAQYPQARNMIDRGLAVVLATDFNPGSSPIASMSFVMSLACAQMKMLPSEALTACTINAAHSLGLAEEVGSIEAGKRADLLIHEFADYREIAYWIAAPMRPTVIAGGAIVAQDGASYRTS